MFLLIKLHILCNFFYLFDIIVHIVGDFMKCFNCGVTLDNNSKYCPRCGTLFTKEKDVILYSDREDIKYLSIYYSSGRKRVYFYNISLGYLFFSFLYAFYKKLYIEGIYSLLGFCLFMCLLLYAPILFIGSVGFLAVPIIFAFMFSLFLYFYYLFKFNEIYISKMKSRINNIIKSNPDASEEEIIKLCEKDSKPNVILPLVLVIFMVILLLVLFML